MVRRFVRAGVVVAVLMPVPGAPAAEELLGGWPTLAGSGLFTLPAADTLRPGGVSVSVNIDNRDRDPLGIDLLDGAVAVTAGLGRRAEAYGSFIFTRVASMPEPPALPPAPLDLIAPPGAPLPGGPLHTHYAPMPYVDKRGTARFDSFVPGDAAMGVKLRLLDARGARPALAAAAEVKVPVTKDPADLRSGSGTGGVDVRLRAIAQWTGARGALVASAAYTRTGDGALGDRRVQVRADGTAAVSDAPLELADRVLAGLGGRWALSGGVAAVAELSADVDVGARTANLDTRTPVDALAGLQARVGGARVTAALRYHAHALPSGARRVSPLGGLVDVTAVGDADLSRYLAQLGAAAALPQLRPGSHRVVAAGSGGPALPPGAQRLPADYAIRSEHNVGFLIALGWTF